jgi:hypothetical protein
MHDYPRVHLEHVSYFYPEVNNPSALAGLCPIQPNVSLVFFVVGFRTRPCRLPLLPGAGWP